MLTPQIKCNLCDQRQFKVVEEDQQPYNVLKCKNCSLVFVWPHPPHVELETHYDNGYYDEWISRQKARRQGMWRKRLKKVAKFKSSGYLLDVGCGEGAFLGLAQKKGWQVSGTEISAFAARYASEALNTDIFCGDLLSAHFKENYFDVVTMWHVLEHVDDPKKYLSEIQRILKPDGLFVLAVPNVNNLVFQIVYRIIRGRSLKLFTIGEKEIHLYHFSPVTLKRYLAATGFSCLSLAPDYGIIEPAKKIVNWISTIPYYLAGMQIFDAIEVVAVPKR
ncbi:class I SAM-dependent methyltransferase [bacterium]|nr:class I SAM-dependent methyltransferase [bacterium]